MITLEKYNFSPALWWRVEEITEHLKVSRSAAYKLLQELPDAYKARLIDPDTGRTTVVGTAKACKAYWLLHNKRGNPRFQDPRFQAEMARKRHRKA